MPLTTLTLSQASDLAALDRLIWSLAGDLAATQGTLDRLIASGLPGARQARREVGRAVLALHAAADALADACRGLAAEDDEAPPF